VTALAQLRDAFSFILDRPAAAALAPLPGDHCLGTRARTLSDLARFKRGGLRGESGRRMWVWVGGWVGATGWVGGWVGLGGSFSCAGR
jgi:hypothetical protein